jgi:hypothetical protein
MLDETMEYLLDPTSPSPSSTSEGVKPTSEGVQPTSEETPASGIQEARKILEEGSEVLLVDDGSSDGTAEKARELVEKWEERVEKAGGKVEIRVVRLVKNRGKGGAVQHVSGPRRRFDGFNHSGWFFFGALECAFSRPTLPLTLLFPLTAAPSSRSAARQS